MRHNKRFHAARSSRCELGPRVNRGVRPLNVGLCSPGGLCRGVAVERRSLPILVGGE